MKKMIQLLMVTLLLTAMIGSVCTADDNDGKINLNTATRDQLISVGLSPEVADGILEQREENGQFVDIEELLDVDGIDPSLLRQLKKKVFIEEVKGCNC